MSNGIAQKLEFGLMNVLYRWLKFSVLRFVAHSLAK